MVRTAARARYEEELQLRQRVRPAAQSTAGPGPGRWRADGARGSTPSAAALLLQLLARQQQQHHQHHHNGSRSGAVGAEHTNVHRWRFCVRSAAATASAAAGLYLYVKQLRWDAPFGASGLGIRLFRVSCRTWGASAGHTQPARAAILECSIVEELLSLLLQLLLLLLLLLLLMQCFVWLQQSLVDCRGAFFNDLQRLPWTRRVTTSDLLMLLYDAFSLV